MTSWTSNLILVQSAAVLGSMLGLALGVSYFSKATRRIIAIGYTATIIPWLLLNIIIGEEDLFLRIASLGGRILYGLGELIRTEPVQDPIIFITAASLIFWFMGIFGGQRILENRKILAGLIPPSLPILLIQYYDGYRTERVWIVAVYFGLLLLMIGRINYLENASLWREKRVFTGSEPEFDINNSILLATVMIVALAWMLPTPASALPAAARWWRENSQPLKSTQERISNALAALTSPRPVSAERYGNVMALGNNAGEGEGTLFRVNAPLSSLPRYYWRARVYDTYENGQWQNTETRTRTFSPELEAIDIPDPDGQVAEFEFEWFFSSQSSLILPPQPLWASRPAELVYSPAQAEQVDIVNLRATPTLSPGERYLARAALRNPSVVEMREAGDDYPLWIRERYLTLPKKLSPRLSALSQEITSELNTPYDKAEGITNYLRQNIAYNTTIPSPPLGIDALEWFLLTWKSGYCTYYATAEVILLRSAGVPARLAVGYAQGEKENGLYVVRPKNAHAWPEVYFPGIGWVEFEPTVNQLPLSRPSGIERDASNEPDDESLFGRPGMERDQPLFNDEPEPRPVSSPTTTAANILQYKAVLTWIIIIPIFGIASYWLWKKHRQISFAKRLPKFVLFIYHKRGSNIPAWLERWERWSELTDVERAFHAINQCMLWLNKPQPDYITPSERVQQLKKLVPNVSQDITILAHEHEMTLYSPISGNSSKATQAAWKIRYHTIRQIISRVFSGAPS